MLKYVTQERFEAIDRQLRAFGFVPSELTLVDENQIGGTFQMPGIIYRKQHHTISVARGYQGSLGYGMSHGTKPTDEYFVMFSSDFLIKDLTKPMKLREEVNLLD